MWTATATSQAGEEVEIGDIENSFQKVTGDGNVVGEDIARAGDVVSGHGNTLVDAEFDDEIENFVVGDKNVTDNEFENISNTTDSNNKIEVEGSTGITIGDDSETDVENVVNGVEAEGNGIAIGGEEAEVEDSANPEFTAVIGSNGTAIGDDIDHSGVAVAGSSGVAVDESDNEGSGISFGNGATGVNVGEDATGPWVSPLATAAPWPWARTPRSWARTTRATATTWHWATTRRSRTRTTSRPVPAPSSGTTRESFGNGSTLGAGAAVGEDNETGPTGNSFGNNNSNVAWGEELRRRGPGRDRLGRRGRRG